MSPPGAHAARPRRNSHSRLIATDPIGQGTIFYFGSTDYVSTVSRFVVAAKIFATFPAIAAPKSALFLAVK